ncbi:hypothetical protein SKAU_G00068630 [Synaphobranchus kaupii]|uniref:Uncharacterized protein n=1 Tax=Synaphobranchus kaupii TaxID=118154 RepID=A0A9Q1G6A2_SYNKA|nr:hypothetical protein SKAU_G00068630 [Synaphobranchus kaupii]
MKCPCSIKCQRHIMLTCLTIIFLPYFFINKRSLLVIKNECHYELALFNKWKGTVKLHLCRGVPVTWQMWRVVDNLYTSLALRKGFRKGYTCASSLKNPPGASSFSTPRSSEEHLAVWNVL